MLMSVLGSIAQWIRWIAASSLVPYVPPARACRPAALFQLFIAISAVRSRNEHLGNPQSMAACTGRSRVRVTRTARHCWPRSARYAGVGHVLLAGWLTALAAMVCVWTLPVAA
eukprot:COSAG02_NODE_1972_length_10217_cov_140.461653_4_plen_113_part_00